MAGILDEFLLIFRPTVKGSGFNQLNKQIQQTHESMLGFNNLFRGFFAFDIYSGIKQFGSQLVQTSKDLGAMEARFYAITKSEKLAGDELNWVLNLAQKTATPLKATADSYSIFYAAVAKSVGQTGARQIFQDWTEVSRVLHLSEYQFERVTYALREMASKGAIYSQDLRMQIGTHVPNAMGLAEKAANQLGYTGTDWFDKFQKAAKGNQKLINEWLKLFSGFAKEQFASADALAEAMKKPDSALQALSNSWQLLQMGIVKAGFDKDLVNTLGELNAILSKIAFHADKIYPILKAISKIFLVIGGLVIFKKIGGWSKLLFGKARVVGIAVSKTWQKFRIAGKFISKLWTGIFGKSLARFVVTLIRSPKMIAKIFGLLIPGIGEVLGIIMTVQFVIEAIWRILKIFFPNVMTSLEDVAKTIWIKIITPIQNFFGGIGKWWNSLFNKGGGVNFPQGSPRGNVTPWDTIKNQNLINPLVNRTYPNVAGNTTVSPIIYNTNNISANGLSEDQIANMIDEANNKNNQKLTDGIKRAVANSKNTYS